MNEPLGLTGSLEKQLIEARKEKTLARVPALRRLNLACRVFLVLAVLSLVVLLPLSGPLLRNVFDLARSLHLGTSSWIFFGLYCLVDVAALALGIFQMAVYSRFIRQFKRNDVEGVSRTAGMLPRVLLYGLAGLVLIPFLVVGIFQTWETAVGAFSANAFMAVIQVVFLALVWHYVRTAQAELPTLTEAGVQATGHPAYWSWQKLYGWCCVVSFFVLTTGFLAAAALPGFGPALGGQPVQASDVAWEWPLPQGWMESAEKPGNLSVLRFSADQSMASGLVIEPGSEYQPEILAANVEKALKQLSSDAKVGPAHEIERAGRTWLAFDVTITLEGQPFHYLYRVHQNRASTLTLLAWSLEEHFTTRQADLERELDGFRLTG